MSFIPRVHEVYKHFKGDLYQITAIAEHTETGEQLVVYQALYGEFKSYARPLPMFIGRVDKEKYPEVAQEFRFELQGPEAERQKAECGVEGAASEVGTKESVKVSEPDGIKEEAAGIDPMLMEFLDSSGYEEKLNILVALQHRITDEMITTMAIACDVEIEDGDLEQRYEALKGCLITMEKYECNRLR